MGLTPRPPLHTCDEGECGGGGGTGTVRRRTVALARLPTVEGDGRSVLCPYGLTWTYPGQGVALGYIQANTAGAEGAR